MGCSAPISWPTPPSCLGKVPTDQKSGENWAWMEWGWASFVLSGDR